MQKNQQFTQRPSAGVTDAEKELPLVDIGPGDAPPLLEIKGIGGGELLAGGELEMADLMEILGEGVGVVVGHCLREPAAQDSQLARFVIDGGNGFLQAAVAGEKNLVLLKA